MSARITSQHRASRRYSSVRHMSRHPRFQLGGIGSVLLAAGMLLHPALHGVAFATDGLTDIGVLPGGSWTTTGGISADGSVLAGFGNSAASGGQDMALRWTAATGAQPLGTLNGGTFSQAYGISADGNIVVGLSTDGSVANHQRAFRWTQVSGMQGLGTLNGGSDSMASAISANGSTIVGVSADGTNSNVQTAFRWTQALGMQSLGMLNGGNFSFANAASNDGSVIVGDAADGASGGALRAFRWTQVTGLQSLGTLNGGTQSRAMGVSGDGSVVVGDAVDGADAGRHRAYRWTQATGMQSLGAIHGGFISRADAVSADGRTVVGHSADGAAGNAIRAFRWTSATGMQSVEQWLVNAGVTLAPSLHLVEAFAVNPDGSVVAGINSDNHAYIARVSPIGSGVISVPAFHRSLLLSGSPQQLGVQQSDGVMHGMHSNLLRGLPDTGRYKAWVAGDWGRQNQQGSSGPMGAGEIGLAYGVSDSTQVRMALGQTDSRLSTVDDGSTRRSGSYLLPEIITAPGDGSLRLSASLYFNDGRSDVDRGYLNAGLPDHSIGSAASTSSALRLRADWPSVLQWSNTQLGTYVSATAYEHRVGGYTETGGGFPVRWDARNEAGTMLHAGLDADHVLSNGMHLLAKVEAGYRVNENGSAATGEILGLGAFSQPGVQYQREWLRLGLGMEAQAGPGVATVMLNGTTESNAPSVWLHFNYHISF